jgi:hypothetical protein
MTQDSDRSPALRSARLALIAAAQTEDARVVDFALVTYVGVLYATSFSAVTIRALVEAALDAGLPAKRRPANRESRDQELARWLARAERLLDELPPTIPRRPIQYRDDGHTDPPRRANGLW